MSSKSSKLMFFSTYISLHFLLAVIMNGNLLHPAEVRENIWLIYGLRIVQEQLFIVYFVPSLHTTYLDRPVYVYIFVCVCLFECLSTSETAIVAFVYPFSTWNMKFFNICKKSKSNRKLFRKIINLLSIAVWQCWR